MHRRGSLIVTPRFTEKGNLEVLLFTIQSKLRANNQKVYAPREGRLISDINKVSRRPLHPEHLACTRPSPSRLTPASLLTHKPISSDQLPLQKHVRKLRPRCRTWSNRSPNPRVLASLLFTNDIHKSHDSHTVPPQQVDPTVLVIHVPSGPGRGGRQ